MLGGVEDERQTRLTQIVLRLSPCMSRLTGSDGSNVLPSTVNKSLETTACQRSKNLMLAKQWTQDTTSVSVFLNYKNK